MVENSELRKAGLKVTLPRVKILQMLDSSVSGQRHMSAEDVYKALMEAGEDVGLATVYRVLTQFEAAGLVERHNFDGGHAVFELADGGHLVGGILRRQLAYLGRVEGRLGRQDCGPEQ